MSRQLSDMPVRPDEPIASSTTGSRPVLKKQRATAFWPWFGGLLVVGLVIVAIVTFSVWNWLNNLQGGLAANQNSPAISTMNVGRSALYADLNVTWSNTQYALAFRDDPIHAGSAAVRVMLSLHNPTPLTIVIAPYDAVRLLAPGQQPLAPTNLALPAALAAGSTQNGWLDFPVAKNIDLKTLKLQIGDSATKEMLVTIPASGSYSDAPYKPRTYHPSLTVTYYFKGWQQPGYNLIYHLNSIDVRDSYNGVETKEGQQFYVLNFTVDNPNGADVSPGYGYDYLRLALNGGNRPPMDNTLPNTFKASAQSVGGHVAFVGPAGLHDLTIVFLRQAVAGGDPYDVSW